MLLVYLQIKAIEKKNEYRFSIFYEEQLYKEELLGQSKYGWEYIGSWIAVFC